MLECNCLKVIGKAGLLIMKKNLSLGIAYITLSVLLSGCGEGDVTTNNVQDTRNIEKETQAVEVSATQDTIEKNQEAASAAQSTGTEALTAKPSTTIKVDMESATHIGLSDEGITVNGEAVSTNATEAVYTAKDIVYYEAGKDFTYGEGSDEDEHTSEEADLHTVVHITKPGTYVVSGKLSSGQLAIDLGEGAKKDSDAVVNVVLNGADISCSVAPAVIFYDVYECGSKDEEGATAVVDTSKSGANVIIADDTVNNIEGSYVARIYESYELNEDGTEIVDSEKLHKYDGAFYSKRSMSIYGGDKGTGILNIIAENEGLDSELHLTMNGGNVNIMSGNDGINTNEDNVSVTTINGGNLKIVVDGSSGEGDGIDSNGWLVINGGTVMAEACSTSADAGIDSDKGIHINGGTVMATGNMLDHISTSEQNYVVMNFADIQKGDNTYMLKNDADEIVIEYTPVNDFTYLIYADDMIAEGKYTAWMNDVQLQSSAGGMVPTFAMDGEAQNDIQRPNMSERPEMPEGEMPADMQNPERKDGKKGNRGSMKTVELSEDFEITSQGNYFMSVQPCE